MTCRPYPLLMTALLAGGLASCGKKANPAPDAKPVAKHAENVITLTAEHLKHMILKTESAALGSLGTTLKAAGRVSANLNQTAKVTSTFEGRLTRLHFDLNDPVSAGAVMALVESPELLGKQLQVKAPIDGVVIERKATTGELVDRAKEIYTISDPTQLWVIAEVKERDIAAVKVGQDATFSTLAYPDEKFHGKVILIGNQVESGSRTLEVRIAVDNREGRLKPGMFADVAIVTTVLEKVLLVSDSAVQTDGNYQTVFVALDNRTFEKRVVDLGFEQSGRVQVLSGLKPGEDVVTEGSFILKSEMLKSELGEE